MPRNKTLLVYNASKQSEQDWTIYSEGVINQSVKIGSVRKSYTITLSGDVTMQFGVDDAVYLKATYTYSTDSWTSETATPNEMSFSAAQTGVSVSSSYSR